MNFNFLKNKNVAIDLGNNNTLISDRNRILLSQPSYIVLDSESHAVKAVGEKAFNMFEKNHESLKPIKPLRGGVIADYDSATKMIQELVMNAYPTTSFFSGYNNIIAGIPFYATSVERKALRDALGEFNSRKAYMVYEPLAAALGIGLNIKEPEGKMLIDIGGGVTEIVIISLSGISSFQCLTVAGDAFDTEIQDHFRKQYNMAIGLKTAEQVKIGVGAVSENIKDAPARMQVRGKDLMAGIPVVRTIGHQEVARILEKSISAIEIGILQTLETCLPELAADIYQGGIHVTGGNAMLRGLRERFEKRLNLPVHIDSQALYSVTKGIAQTLNDPAKFEAILME
ncbi:MAG TPA: rod shape-determining protein [Chryseolinea sp.]|nr:rod shape-determining protein [Chryseolinea sp.]